MEHTKSSTHDRELILTRKINAPIALIWELWSKPEHIVNWWGPNGFTTTIMKMDMTPGGEWNLTLHGPDGTDYENRSIFKEIVPFKKIVYEHISYPYILATIEFEEHDEQTLINWHMLFKSAEDFIQVVKVYHADEGQKQNLDKLEIYLAAQWKI